MSKAVLISIHPEGCEKIASGKKTIEVRKTRPKLPTPFKCYIYCTRGERLWLSQSGNVVADKAYNRILDDLPALLNGKVFGEFVCDEVETYDDDTIHAFTHEDYSRWNDFDLDRACMHPEDFEHYANDSWLHGWHISALKIYEEPKELREFTPYCEFLDGDECPNYLRVGCPYQQIDYNQDASVNCVMCGRRLTRAPQSWCYVEELT